MLQRKAQDTFPWALIASAGIHCLLIFFVLIPKLDNNYAFGAWFTLKADGPLLHVKLSSPVQTAVKAETELNLVPALVAEQLLPTTPHAVTEASAATQNTTPQVKGLGLPNAVFAGAINGNEGASGPAGDLSGRLMESAQWHARKSSAFNYFLAVEQSLSWMPKPPVTMKCVIKNERHNCPEEVASYVDILVNRLAFVYQIYPSFSAIQIRYDMDVGWSLEVL